MSNKSNGSIVLKNKTEILNNLTRTINALSPHDSDVRELFQKLHSYLERSSTLTLPNNNALEVVENGKKGNDGAHGENGKDATLPGAAGRDGMKGNNGEPGENCPALYIALCPLHDESNSFAVVTKKSDVKILSLYNYPDISLIARGGDGGRGGNGGSGGNGAEGKAGDNATATSPATNGGDGGDAGKGAIGGDGGDGGDGGRIVVVTTIDDSDLLLAISNFNTDPGEGGLAGQGGNAGRPGVGGRPGEGFNSATSDTNSSSEANTSSEKVIVRPPGKPGMPGRVFPNAHAGRDGKSGQAGDLLYALLHAAPKSSSHAPSTSVSHYQSLYQLVVDSIAPYSSYTGVMEPGQTLSCYDLKIKNLGMMPSPADRLEVGFLPSQFYQQITENIPIQKSLLFNESLAVTSGFNTSQSTSASTSTKNNVLSIRFIKYPVVENQPFKAIAMIGLTCHAPRISSRSSGASGSLSPSEVHLVSQRMNRNSTRVNSNALVNNNNSSNNSATATSNQHNAGLTMVSSEFDSTPRMIQLHYPVELTTIRGPRVIIPTLMQDHPTTSNNPPTNSSFSAMISPEKYQACLVMKLRNHCRIAIGRSAPFQPRHLQVKLTVSCASAENQLTSPSYQEELEVCFAPCFGDATSNRSQLHWHSRSSTTTSNSNSNSSAGFPLRVQHSSSNNVTPNNGNTQRKNSFIWEIEHLSASTEVVLSGVLTVRCSSEAAMSRWTHDKLIVRAEVCLGDVHKQPDIHSQPIEVIQIQTFQIQIASVPRLIQFQPTTSTVKPLPASSSTAGSRVLLLVIDALTDRPTIDRWAGLARQLQMHFSIFNVNVFNGWSYEELLNLPFPVSSSSSTSTARTYREVLEGGIVVVLNQLCYAELLNGSHNNVNNSANNVNNHAGNNAIANTQIIENRVYTSEYRVHPFEILDAAKKFNIRTYVINTIINSNSNNNSSNNSSPSVIFPKYLIPTKVNSSSQETDNSLVKTNTTAYSRVYNSRTELYESLLNAVNTSSYYPSSIQENPAAAVEDPSFNQELIRIYRQQSLVNTTQVSQELSLRAQVMITKLKSIRPEREYFYILHPTNSNSNNNYNNNNYNHSNSGNAYNHTQSHLSTTYGSNDALFQAEDNNSVAGQDSVDFNASTSTSTTSSKSPMNINNSAKNKTKFFNKIFTKSSSTSSATTSPSSTSTTTTVSGAASSESNANQQQEHCGDIELRRGLDKHYAMIACKTLILQPTATSTSTSATTPSTNHTSVNLSNAANLSDQETVDLFTLLKLLPFQRKLDLFTSTSTSTSGGNFSSILTNAIISDLIDEQMVFILHAPAWSKAEKYRSAKVLQQLQLLEEHDFNAIFHSAGMSASTSTVTSTTTSSTAKNVNLLSKFTSTIFSKSSTNISTSTTNSPSTNTTSQSNPVDSINPTTSTSTSTAENSTNNRESVAVTPGTVSALRNKYNNNSSSSTSVAKTSTSTPPSSSTSGNVSALASKFNKAPSNNNIQTTSNKPITNTTTTTSTTTTTPPPSTSSSIAVTGDNNKSNTSSSSSVTSSSLLSTVGSPEQLKDIFVRSRAFLTFFKTNLSLFNINANVSILKQVLEESLVRQYAKYFLTSSSLSASSGNGSGSANSHLSSANPAAIIQQASKEFKLSRNQIFEQLKHLSWQDAFQLYRDPYNVSNNLPSAGAGQVVGSPTSRWSSAPNKPTATQEPSSSAVVPVQAQGSGDEKILSSCVTFNHWTDLPADREITGEMIQESVNNTSFFTPSSEVCGGSADELVRRYESWTVFQQPRPPLLPSPANSQQSAGGAGSLSKPKGPPPAPPSKTSKPGNSAGPTGHLSIVSPATASNTLIATTSTTSTAVVSSSATTKTIVNFLTK